MFNKSVIVTIKKDLDYVKKYNKNSNNPNFNSCIIHCFPHKFLSISRMSKFQFT